jgi:hypothetical protein
MKWTQDMWQGWKRSVLGTPEMSVTPLTRHRHKRSVRDIINVPGHNICFKDTTNVSERPNVCQGQYIHIKDIKDVSVISHM